MTGAIVASAMAWLVFAVAAIAHHPTWKTLRTCLLAAVLLAALIGLALR